MNDIYSLKDAGQQLLTIRAIPNIFETIFEAINYDLFQKITKYFKYHYTIQSFSSQRE